MLTQHRRLVGRTGADRVILFDWHSGFQTAFAPCRSARGGLRAFRVDYRKITQRIPQYNKSGAPQRCGPRRPLLSWDFQAEDKLRSALSAGLAGFHDRRTSLPRCLADECGAASDKVVAKQHRRKSVSNVRYIFIKDT